MHAPAWLVFEDGTAFPGRSIGRQGETFGEAVFNTSMSGYQEILTDPSYRGQVVVMTYPLIGNYGIAPADGESKRCWLEGFVVRELSKVASNFRSVIDLNAWLDQQGVVGIDEVDTRAIVRKIRAGKVQRVGISSTERDAKKLHERVLASPRTDGLDLVKTVTRAKAERWTEGLDLREFQPVPELFPGPRYKVVAYDFGMKSNILRSLTSAGFDVEVVPAATPWQEVVARQPDGVFFSNGPGDPEPVTYAVENARAFLEQRIPFFGICLGHQLLGLALDGRTRKMPFGHHGGNQPVLDRATGNIEITAQNHSFMVDPDSLDLSKVEISHINLNDQTVEGLRCKQLPAFSVQYHPEAAPGPHDSLYLFKRFRQLIEQHRPAAPGVAR
ncbi:MAG: glutamine-hydrolyzing carbamoyl-phosphate synthase small subunit [Planctomycetes bacterium]|nr:glutamine-hydrolyzing carbamoyl-phosphate synthase small subunit [Planctomycetota bacterium]